MPVMNKPTYLEPEDFAAYCRGPVQNMLSLLSISLKPGSQKLKQAGARALGYSCFEALASRWSRKESILRGLYAERCPSQRDRLTVKCGNIQVVYHPGIRCFIGMALRPGEECRYLDPELADYDEVAMVHLPPGAEIDLSSLKNFNREGSPSQRTVEDTLDDTYRAEFSYTIAQKDSSGTVAQGVITFLRTHEGLIVDVYDTGEERDEVIGSFGIMFTDRQENEAGPEEVRLYDAQPAYGGACSEVYCWFKTGVDNDEKSRLLHINPNEEMDISDLLFDSAQQAIDAANSGNWGIDREGMMEEGAVLVCVTHTIVSSPF